MPLFISVAAFIWIFNVVDGLTTPRTTGCSDGGSPDWERQRRRPRSCWSDRGAQRLWPAGLPRGEGWLLKVPVFRTIYAPVKQLIAAFSPDNESGFKRVVMIEDPRRGYALGFQTREFTVDRGRGPEPLLAVYVPTNNLYLGDIVIVERDRATFPDISVEDGIKIFLTGGMALPPRVRI